MPFITPLVSMLSGKAETTLRGGFRAILLTAAVASGLVTVSASAGASSRTQFIARHRCPLVAALREIHSVGPVHTSRDRFVTLSMQGYDQRYVQCIFMDRDTAMYCEASSEAYGTDASSLVRFVPTEDTLHAVRELGFVQENPKGNFSQVVPLGSPPDVRIAANLMLATLHDAYGATLDRVIEMDAPKGGNASRQCGAPIR